MLLIYNWRGYQSHSGDWWRWMHITCTLDCSSNRQTLITTYVPGERVIRLFYIHKGNLLILGQIRTITETVSTKKTSCFTFLFKTVLCFLLLTVFTDISMPFLIFFCRSHVKKRCEMELLGILRRQLMQLCNLPCCLWSTPFLLRCEHCTWSPSALLWFWKWNQCTKDK